MSEITAAAYQQRWAIPDGSINPIFEISLDPSHQVLGYNRRAAEELNLSLSISDTARTIASGLHCQDVLACSPEAQAHCPITALKNGREPEAIFEFDTTKNEMHKVQATQIVGIDNMPTVSLTLSSAHEHMMRNLNLALLRAGSDIRSIFSTVFEHTAHINHDTSSISLKQNHITDPVVQVVDSRGFEDVTGLVNSLQFPATAPHYLRMDEEQAVIKLNDVKNQSGWVPGLAELEKYSSKHQLAGPLIGFDEQGISVCKGYVFLGRIEDRPFTDRDAQKLQDVLDLASQAFRHAQATRDLKELSIRDGLTNLFNRRFMEEFLAKEIAQARRDDRSLSAIMIDVDELKKYNDTYGHIAGDEVLKKIAAILQEGVRDGDIACRPGGDEFALILPGADKEVALKIAERIKTKIAEIILSFDEISRVTMSMGIATFPKQADTSELLLKDADIAMYWAKQNGKNTIAVFDDNMKIENGKNDTLKE